MQMLSLSPKQRYGIAVLSVIAAALLRGWLEWFLGMDLHVFFFIVPVIVAGWYGGLWPGLLATGLSLLFGDLLLILPRGSIFPTKLFSIRSGFWFLHSPECWSAFCVRKRDKALTAGWNAWNVSAIFVESVPGYAILITDPDGRICCWNTAAERMTGYSEREVLGHDLSIILPEKTSYEEGQRALEIARTVGYCEQEGWQTRKDSSRFWASEVVAALRNQAGQMCGVAKIIRDTTEHKLADEAIERSENFVRNIVDVSPSLMYIFDIEQKKNVFINRAAAEVLGYAEAQVREPGFLSSVMDPADWGPFLDHVRRLGGLQANESADFEYRMRHRDGAWRWFHSRDKVFTLNADGRAREIVGAATDITERKNAEEKLKESDDRYRAFIANSSEGIWRYEMDEPVPVTLPADEQIELFYHRGYLAECNEVFACSHGYASVDEILGQRLTVLSSGRT